MALLLLTAIASIQACSPLYVMRAAYEESRILLRREKIERVIENPETTDLERRKLRLVLAAREYAAAIGLEPGESFTRFSRVDKDVLAWVLLASRDDSFALHHWWFPIVGQVPYKGFFDREDAEAESQRLVKKRYETWIRGTEAFSTLGWFNDPVLSTTLKNDDARIVNTVIHESVHSTIWVPGHVDFNESLANFVGNRGAVEFYAKSMQDCGGDEACRTALKPAYDLAERNQQIELELADVVSRLSDELGKLYDSELSREEKLARRPAVFDGVMLPVRARYPELKILKSVNNAEIIQLKLYLTCLRCFASLYSYYPHDYPGFISEIKKINEAVESDPALKPFDLLQKRLAELDGAPGAALEGDIE